LIVTFFIVSYSSNVFTNNLGQVIILNFSLNFNFGRKNKQLDNSDTDTGIMTGTKK